MMADVKCMMEEGRWLMGGWFYKKDDCGKVTTDAKVII
jgi:hypothetical protein